MFANHIAQSLAYGSIALPSEHVMSRGKAPKEIKERRKRPKKEQSSSPYSFSHLVRAAWWMLGAVGLFLGIAASAFYFLPTVSLAQTEPLDLKNVLSVPFVVTNTAPYAMSRLNAVCETNVIVAPNGLVLGNNVGQSVSLGPLEAGDRGVVHCDVGAGGFDGPVKADITIVVIFKPWWWVLKPRSRYFRFQGERIANGMLRWVERPYRGENPYHISADHLAR